LSNAGSDGDSERAADHESQHRARRADAEARAQAVEDRREHVAALIIGAEPVGHPRCRALAGRETPVEQVELGEIVRVLRRHEGRAQGKEEDRRKDEEPGHRNP